MTNYKIYDTKGVFLCNLRLPKPPLVNGYLLIQYPAFSYTTVTVIKVDLSLYEINVSSFDLRPIRPSNRCSIL